MNLGAAGHVMGWQLKRIGQTPAHFRNWPSLLVAIGSSKLGRGPAEVTFRPRRPGPTITVPNTKGAFVPTYEVFAEDCYELGWFLGDLADRPFHAVDIGAHVGTFACHLASRSPRRHARLLRARREHGRVPPSQHRRQRLRRPDHRAPSSASPARRGTPCSSRRGWRAACNHLAFDGNGHGDHADDGDLVPTVSFDDVVAKAAAPVELVKMDCEGGEYDLVLRSAPGELGNACGGWSSSTTPSRARAGRSSAAWLAAAGLSVVHEREDGPGLGLAWLSRDAIDGAPGHLG